MTMRIPDTSTALALLQEDTEQQPAGQDDTAGSNGTHTLERALTVLKAFGGYPGSLSNADLVRKTGFSKASISRITATLVALRYLDRAADGLRFQIGMRGLILGHNYLANSPIRQLARPIMQRFADRHDMSVALAVGDGLDTLYIEYCKSQRIVALRLGVGSRMPMELTSIGRTYLWTQQPKVRERLLFDIMKKGGSDGPAILDRMKRAFDHLEKYGYCVTIGEYQRDAFGVSVPVQLGNPPVPMALNCGAISANPERAHIHDVLAPDLIDTAESLKSALSGVESILF
jgi:DNA-binding IclR family transcriptional regulator